MTGPSTPPSPADDFWEASALSEANAAAFGTRVAAFVPPEPTIHPFVGPAAPVPLRPVTDRAQRRIAARRSTRTFDRRPLTHRHVEQLLAAVGPTPDGRRAVPEAGGIDAVHAYVIAHRVEGPLEGRIARYDHRAHAVADVGPSPDEADLRRLFLVDDEADVPAAVIAFVLDLGEVTAKYGPRAMRFALQQVGHAAQNVSLRLAADGLAGYVLGGGLDREVLALLGLAHTRARYGGAVACGR